MHAHRPDHPRPDRGRGARRRPSPRVGAIPVVAAASALAVTLGASAALAPTAGADEAASTPELAWGPCPDRVLTPTAQCAPLTVPRDYGDPDGGTIEVTVMRQPAADPSARRGVLFGNAGGPGGDSLPFFDDGLFHWPQELRNEFDLVAVQPRGLPDATPVECPGQESIDPVTAATNYGGALRALCEDNQPGYAEHVTTENTARDWEEARKALGEDRIDILGLSYGTALGSVYATLFPERTDKLVLDSAVDTHSAWNGLMDAQDPAYKVRMNDMFAWIAEHDAEYHLGTTALQVYQRWSDVIVSEVGVNPSLAPPPARVGDVPPAFSALAQQYVDGVNLTNPARVQLENLVATLTHPGTSQLNSTVLAQTRMAVPQSAAWPGLAEGIAAGAPDPAAAADSPLNDPEVLEQVGQSATMQRTVMCNENQVPANPLAYPEFLWTSFVSGDIFDLYGATFTSGAACAGWAPVTRLPEVSSAALATKPLQLQGLHDPQTPYAQSLAVHDRMQSHLVTVDGGDHGQFAKSNPTVDDAVLEFLRTGRTEVTDAPAPPIPMAAAPGPATPTA